MKFLSNRESEAFKKYSEQELRGIKSNQNVVLVSVDKARNPINAYLNYYSNIREFIKILEETLDGKLKKQLILCP